MTTRSIRTTCPYCGVGCGVRAEYRDNRLIAVSGDTRHPANAGRLCVKGSTLPETQRSDGRLLEPRIHGEAVTWDTALDRVAREFDRVIRDHGPDAVAMYLSGQLLTEDYYVANKLMKGFLGSGNVDTNSRLCMASAVAAHKRAFGEDVVPCDYTDLEQCELLVLVGSNAAWAHPVLFQRIASRQADGKLRVVVVDPRRTATSEIADLHLAIKPGSDVALFNGLFAHLQRAGAVSRHYVDLHTEGFEAALAAARHDAVNVQDRTGLPRHALDTFFHWFAATTSTVTLFSQGVNQSSNGTDKANAIINCHLATGRIGAPGMGPFSITGQPNAMGGREVGGMANQLAAHLDFASPDLERIGRFWNATNLARGPGLKAVDMFDAVARGEIRAIWIMGTNPVVSLPRSNAVREALLECPFVVVSDCVEHTDTTVCADVLLPASGWGEKDGTVTNSERCISRQRAFLEAPGAAKSDWWIVCQVAARMGFADAFGYRHAHEIFREHAELSGFENDGKRAFDIGALAGLSRAEYDALEPIRWPLGAARPDGGTFRRPFSDGVFSTPTGRARLIAVRDRAPVQQPDAVHRFVLNTGRLRDQWHTMTRTGVAPRLFGHTDVPTVHLNPADAERMRITPGELVELRNAHGRLRGIAEPSSEIAEGQLFFPMHWNDQFAGPTRANALIDNVTDPHSGQPESKHAAVSLVRCRASAWLRMACTQSLPGDMLAHDVLFWTGLPTEGGWRYELALAAGVDHATYLERLRVLVEHDNPVEFVDTVTGERRLLLERRHGPPVLVVFAHPQRAALPPAAFVARALVHSDKVEAWRMLAGPEGADADCSRAVCTCFGVREHAIRAAAMAGARTTAELGRQLRCGTNCGSCLPELRALIAACHQR